MKTTEFIFSSLNTAAFSKRITALVIEPEVTGPDTGVMLFSHGWTGNRFRHKDRMEWVAERYNLVTVSVEFRQSGYDFDPIHGRGAQVPYDAGFYQVFDVLNALRHVLRQRPEINRRRVYHYGGSQGGQIALLGSLFAPATFSWVYVSCPLTSISHKTPAQTGRHFTPWELTIRSPLELADRIPCPVYIEYGTADPGVPHQRHGQALATRLKAKGRLARLTEYQGGGHDLTPATTKSAAFQAMSEHLDWNAVVTDDNDFDRNTEVRLPCGEKSLVIDWSKACDDLELFRWEEGT